MKNFILLAIVFAVTGCAEKEWTKKFSANECLKTMNKSSKMKELYTTMQIAHLCDCAASKAVVKYKSQREMDKDEAGSSKIAQDCASEVLGK